MRITQSESDIWITSPAIYHDCIYRWCYRNACRLSVVKSKLKLMQRPIRRKENILRNQWELKQKPSKLPKARENAGDQIVIGATFASDWLRSWSGFSGRITERSKTRPMLSWTTFNTQFYIGCVHNGSFGSKWKKKTAEPPKRSVEPQVVIHWTQQTHVWLGVDF